MELLLVRHGPAGQRQAFAKTGRPDAERPLTSEGRAAMKKAAAGLRAVFPRAPLIVTSPLARARQTAELVAKAYGKARLIEWPELAPEAKRAALFRRLSELGDDGAAALVGHEPSLSGLAGFLLAGAKAPALELKKGGALLLELPKACKPGSAELRWLLQPSHLRRLRD